MISAYCAVLTLREAHDEDEVDGDEPEQVTNQHRVDHGNEGTHRLEASAAHRVELIFFSGITVNKQG